MTPKEKALEIKSKHYSNCECDIKAKLHTMITVDEIIKQWEYIDTYLADGQGELNPNLRYWYDVKKEINV